ncbi:MAG TPA: hypothetical protein VKD24_08750 [Candidatus Angelobacter sp.]|nr:hypothetical protein [Candidatus Angelobacter sp.]
MNLLGQVKALSTVSGGSWLGVPFEFLPAAGPTDSAYLGPYVTDPGSLTVTELAALPAGNAGVPIATDFFSPEFLALEAYILWEFLDVPANMLWQTLIGLNILSAYGLYQPGTDLAPTDMFSYDQAALNAIVTANPSLSSETAYLIARQRPFLICNMAMLMNEAGGGVQLLAPVQSTAFLTGILGSPTGTDANGLTPGGGGITSFSFNSNFVSVNNGAALVDQTGQWALTDAVGTSSAFFAEQVANEFAYWENNLDAFFEELKKDFEDILKWIEQHLPFEVQAEARQFVTDLTAPEARALAGSIEFPVLDDMIPQYNYWPAGETSATTDPQPSQFTDGGSLENTGICGMLAYNDIENIISFVNTEVVLAAGQYGVPDANGKFMAGTCVVVDESLPPLFGYQPYDDCGGGYVLYSKTTSPAYPQYANSQVFPSEAFPALLEGLWAASGASAGAQPTSPAIFSQAKLTVQPNKWFGIQGGQTITVVWCYLNYAQDYVNLFAENPAVAQLIANEVATSSFPNYGTIDTNLTATEINLLASLTSWSVVSTDQASNTFSGLFTNTSAKMAGVG